MQLFGTCKWRRIGARHLRRSRWTTARCRTRARCMPGDPHHQLLNRLCATTCVLPRRSEGPRRISQLPTEPFARRAWGARAPSIPNALRSSMRCDVNDVVSGHFHPSSVAMISSCGEDATEGHVHGRCSQYRQPITPTAPATPGPLSRGLKSSEKSPELCGSRVVATM